MPSRVVTVLVDTVVIEDGQVPPPVVGEIGRYWLVFSEACHDEPDATVSTFRAHAESLGDGSPQQGLQWDGTPNGPPRWPTRLSGDGWAATWAPSHPVLGEVELRGTLIGDFGINSAVGICGRIARARVVTETVDTTDPDQCNWRNIASQQQLREVQTSPRRFDHGLVPAHDTTTGNGWYPLVPGHPYVRETGVLVELDNIQAL